MWGKSGADVAKTGKTLMSCQELVAVFSTEGEGHIVGSVLRSPEM